MAWMRDRTSSTKVWPHKVLDHKLRVGGQLKVKRSNSTIRRFDLDEKTIDLASQISDPWDAMQFETHISLDQEQCDIMDVCENTEDAKVAIIINCRSSKYQEVFTAAFESPVTHMTFQLSRSNVFSRILLEPFILLSTDYPQDVSEDFAYSKSSVLSSGMPQTIITDFEESSFGGGINEDFKSFPNSEKHALFKLRFDTDQENNPKPCVVWNSRNRFVMEEIHVTGKEGTQRTIMRDSIIKAVAPFVAFELLMHIDPEQEGEYEIQGIEMQVVDSLRKMLGKNKNSQVMSLLRDFRTMEDSDISARLQNFFKTGSALDELIKRGPQDVE